MKTYNEGDKLVRCTVCRSDNYVDKQGKRVTTNNGKTIPTHWKFGIDMFNPSSKMVAWKCKGSGEKQVTHTYTKVPSKKRNVAFTFKWVADTTA